MFSVFDLVHSHSLVYLLSLIIVKKKALCSLRSEPPVFESAFESTSLLGPLSLRKEVVLFILTNSKYYSIAVKRVTIEYRGNEIQSCHCVSST